MPDFVVRGFAATFETLFYQDNTTSPLVVVGGVTYTITTPSGLVVSSGVAIQDMSNPARWTVNFTIPPSAPLTLEDQRYNLRWRARSATEIVSNNVTFQVFDQAAPDPIDPMVVSLAGQPFSANLVLPYNNPTSLSLRILNDLDTTIISLGDLLNPAGDPPAPIVPTQHGGNWLFAVPINADQATSMVIRKSGLTTYFSYFNYTDPQGIQHTEIQPIYLGNPIVLSAMNDVRQFVDMLRNNDEIIELRITDAKLIHFVLQGLLRVNATSPVNFTFDFTTLMQLQQFYFWIVKCAEYEILSALYLAHGMTSFDFQGMTVQLTSDRTQYIQTIMTDIKADIDNQLPKVKSQYARGGMGGRIGTIGGVWGPASNWVFRAGPFGGGFGNGGLGGGALPVLPFMF